MMVTAVPQTTEFALAKAARDFDISKVRELLRERVDPNAKDEHGCPALHHAVVSKDDPAIAEELLNAQASPNIRDRLGYTALHKAALMGFVRCTQLLLEKGAVMERTENAEKRTPVHLMMSAKKIACLPLFVQKGFNVNTPDRKGRGPLHAAALSDCVEGLTQLITAGANPLALDKEKNSPLHAATSACAHACMRVLLKQGLDMDAQNSQKVTPLQASKEHSCEQCSLIFMEHLKAEFTTATGLAPPSLQLQQKEDNQMPVAAAAKPDGNPLKGTLDEIESDFFMMSILNQTS